MGLLETKEYTMQYVPEQIMDLQYMHWLIAAAP